MITKEAILEQIRQGNTRASGIASALGISQPAVSKAATTLISTGEVIREGRDYRLVESKVIEPATSGDAAVIELGDESFDNQRQGYRKESKVIEPVTEGLSKPETVIESSTSGSDNRREPPFFTIPNLSAGQVERRDPSTYPHPGYHTKDKRVYRKWCTQPDTAHLFYNFSEGLNPHLRVTAENPPQFLHGIIADYDAALPDDPFPEVLERVKSSYAPAWGTRTFSGGARLIWLFEKPMPVHTAAILKRALAKAAQTLSLNALLPGLDEKAALDPCRYFELGTKWQDLGGEPIPASTVWRWVEASTRQKDFKRAGVAIPMLEVQQEVDRRFPGRWSGPFEPGARGVRFWDANADALSVIVRDTGCQCFTGDRPFLSWADIFGRDFVERFQERKIGGAIEGLYFDGRHYWRQLPDRAWQAMNSTTVARHLKVEYSLDPVPAHGEAASELDRVLHEIEEKKAVSGALPFVHHKDTVIRINGRTYLNIATTRCLEPAPGPQPWGKAFPFIASYLERLLEPEPREIFLSWLHRFYRSAYEGRLLKGQAVFLAGPVGVGKTLLSERVVAPLVGGKQEATDFLLGGSSFNKELFEYALWTIDDDPVSGDPKAHLRFSNLVKKVAANHTFNYHAKFRDQLTVPWNGRIFVTCNDDPESIRILPDLDVSIKDKLILLKAGADAHRDFPGNVADLIARELPFFARYLLEYEIPENCLGNSRFGVRSYLDTQLEETARHSSATYSFAEILDLWREEYFTHKKDEDEWTGHVPRLFGEMQESEFIKPLVRDMNPITLGRRLSAMLTHGYEWLQTKRIGRTRKRVFIIHRPEPEDDLLDNGNDPF